MLHSLIYPGHEQHHNNSFLIAAAVQGQSNIAAGVTAGSNHTGRAPDGEIIAGRGFWPALCVNVKHNSRFASYCLLATGIYPAQLDIRFPFALVGNHITKHELVIMPAYWFIGNMYAFARNAWKYAARDRRIHKEQPIEFDPLAPDTAEEMLNALTLLEHSAARAWLHHTDKDTGDYDEHALMQLGRDVLLEQPQEIDKLTLLADDMENSHRPVIILKASSAYRAYRDMLLYYAIRTLIEYAAKESLGLPADMAKHFSGTHRETWFNLGGQIIRQMDLDALRDDITAGRIDSWPGVHECYHRWQADYPRDKARHAFSVLLTLSDTPGNEFTRQQWNNFFNKAHVISETILERIISSRAKDYDDPFRKLTYRNDAEQAAILGPRDENTFIAQARQAHETFCCQLEAARAMR